MTARRSRPRAYLLLSRISNLPTIWSNVLAGMTIAGGAVLQFPLALIALVAVAVSLVYTGGMILNDAFDAPFDAMHRPERPVAAGDVARSEAFAAGGLVILLGVLLQALVSPRSFAWAAILAGTVVLYDYHHKGFRFGPIVMGTCRGLVYCVAASAAAGVSASVLAAALLLTVYTASLTLVAKRAGPRAGIVVPVMIAGMSLLDALVIAWSGGGVLTFVAVVCFALTLAFQRVVPGT